MHHLVKIIKNDDGDVEENPVWHLVKQYGDSARTVCTGKAIGEGESRAEYLSKHVHKGVECPKCREIVNWYKSINL